MQVISPNLLIPAYLPKNTKSVRIHFEFEGQKKRITADEFWELCRQNPQLNVELNKDGEVIVMRPTGFETSEANSEIITQLRNWAKIEKKGKVTDSNGGFILANGAVYAPDASWTKIKRLEKFTSSQLKKFLPLCPDFVVELRSESDSLKDLRQKMHEYLENGASLGWLINPQDKEVEVYRPQQEVEILENPQKVSGEPLLQGFKLDLTEIW